MSKRKTQEEKTNLFKEIRDYDSTYNIELNKLCGMDEAGRGPLMGPVVAAAVILPEDLNYIGINDSKKISERKRLELEKEIKEKALAWGIGTVSAKEIDQIGIQGANFLAFKKALDNLIVNFEITPSLILVDGNYKGIPIGDYTSVVKGDSLSAVISAASILAKTERDRYVLEVCHSKYPDYKFNKHKGYGTKEHREFILEKGLTEFHRKTFCRKILEERGS